MKCDICGKEIDMNQQRDDELPVAAGLELEDGRVINICTECIMSFTAKESK